MRYLFMVIAVCLPTWGAADVLKADKRYLCEAETAFGWPKDIVFHGIANRVAISPA